MKFYMSHHKAFGLIVLVLISGICQVSLFFVVYSADPSRIFAPDSASYLNTARAFLETGHFAVNPEQPDVPQLIRTPGYPFFLAGIFTLFGVTYAPVILVQITLLLGTIAIIYVLASLLWNARVAFLAALWLACEYLSIVSAQQVLTETVFTFCLNMTVLTGVLCLQSAHVSHTRIGLHGLCLAFTILVRPIAYYLPLLLVMLYLLIWKIQRGWSWKRIALLLSMFLIPVLILVGGWQVRNYQAAGSAEFSLIQGANLYFYRGADILAQRDRIPFEQARQQLGYDLYKQLELAPNISGWEIAQLSREWKREGLLLIRRYPWLFLKGQLQGFFSMLFETDWNVLLTHVQGEYQATSGPGGDLLRLTLSEYFRTWILGKPVYVALFGLAAAYLYLLYASCLLSFWHILRRKTPAWTAHLLLGCLILYLLAFSAGAQAYPRFRIPLMPLFSLYAGHGLSLLIAKLTQLSDPRTHP